MEISSTGPIVLRAKSHFMFLKDLFIDTFLAHLISYASAYRRQDVTTSLNTFLKCDLKQPESFINTTLIYLAHTMIYYSICVLLNFSSCWSLLKS